MNVPAVKTLTLVGVETFAQHLTRLGLEGLTEFGDFYSTILSDRESRSVTFGLENALATRFWTAVKAIHQGRRAAARGVVPRRHRAGRRFGPMGTQRGRPRGRHPARDVEAGVHALSLVDGDQQILDTVTFEVRGRHENRKHSAH